MGSHTSILRDSWGKLRIQHVINTYYINYPTFREKNLSLYIEKEVDYVLDMMKNKYKDFKRSEMMRPFYLKAC